MSRSWEGPWFQHFPLVNQSRQNQPFSPLTSRLHPPAAPALPVPLCCSDAQPPSPASYLQKQQCIYHAGRNVLPWAQNQTKCLPVRVSLPGKMINVSVWQEGEWRLTRSGLCFRPNFLQRSDQSTYAILWSFSVLVSQRTGTGHLLLQNEERRRPRPMCPDLDCKYIWQCPARLPRGLQCTNAKPWDQIGPACTSRRGTGSEWKRLRYDLIPTAPAYSIRILMKLDRRL